MTSHRIENLLDSSLKLIEQGIAEGKTDVALAYLKIFCPSSELTDLQLLNLSRTVVQTEQPNWADENYSSTAPSNLSFWQSFKARRELQQLLISSNSLIPNEQPVLLTSNPKKAVATCPLLSLGADKSRFGF